MPTWNFRVAEQQTIQGSSDPYFDKVALLLPLTGVDNSTNFVDVKGRTITSHGGAVISHAQSKFGNGSGYFNAADESYLTYVSNDNLVGDLTVEAFIYCLDHTDDREIFSINNDSSANFLMEIESDDKLRFCLRNDSDSTQLDLYSSTTISRNAWHHVACTVSGSTAYSFIDGTRTASGSISGTRQQGFSIGNIGRFRSGRQRYFDGYIQQFRLTKGLARYVDNFVVPPVFPVR